MSGADKPLQRHELSAMFPDMPGDDFAKLKNDIVKYGLIDEIATFNGQVLDGWHRYQACIACGIQPRFKAFDGDDRAALAFAISKNARRRHLNEASVVSISKLALGWHKNAATEGRPTTTSRDVVTESVVAQAAGVSLPTVQRHTAIERKAPALLPMVERGELGLKTAERIAQVAPVEVLASPSKAQIEHYSRALSERPENRCAALLKAANEFRDQWQALSMLSQTDQAVADAMSEAMFLIRMCRAPN